MVEIVSRVSERKGGTTNQRYTLPKGENPYVCCLCNRKFNSRYSCKRHFQQTCFKANGSPEGVEWDDHPSCLTPVKAHASGIGRPFYPDQYIPGPDGGKLLTWPPGTNWEKDESRLLSQNAAYKAKEGVNPWFYHWEDAAHVSVDELDRAHLGENVAVQLQALLDVLNVNTMKLLLEAAKTSAGREDGFQDDILLAVLLHMDWRTVARMLQLDRDELGKWTSRALSNFARTHILRPGQREKEFRRLFGLMRRRHVRGDKWCGLECCRDGWVGMCFNVAMYGGGVRRV